MLGRVLGKKATPVVSVVSLRGVVDAKLEDRLDRQMLRVSKESVALAVLIDSPGGSPAYSHNIYRKLRLYHENTGKPVYTFAEELAASGGYFILSAGDKAFADRSSLIGSVGVILMRPEYRNMVERFGIKPEILASNKDLMAQAYSPFSDCDEHCKELLQKAAKDIYDPFVQHVETSRKGKLAGTFEERKQSIYHSDVFLGEEGRKLGLVDEVGTYKTVLARDFPEAKIDWVAPYSSLVDLITHVYKGSA